MRTVIWFVLLFVVAVVAASSFGTNDGLVTFFWGVHRVDLSLNLFLLLLIGTCGATAPRRRRCARRCRSTSAAATAAPSAPPSAR
jgi:hypothetical protein